MGSKFYFRLAMVFFAFVMFSFIATSQTTIKIQIADKDDDCEEYLAAGTNPAGYMDMGSSDLELCTETANIPQLVGMIFRDVKIPVGATITNAFVQFECDELDAQVINLTIYGAKKATVPAPFVGTLGEISAYPKTAASVAWSPPEWAIVDEAGPKQATPDIKAIITEIIRLPGWAPGNNMLIMITDPSLIKQHRTAEAYEGEPTGAAILNVTYTGGTGINSINAEFSNLIYPNPTGGKLNINNPSTDKFSYQIYNICGQLVASGHNITGPTTEVDLSDLLKGVYLVDVRTAEKSATHKLVLQ